MIRISAANRNGTSPEIMDPTFPIILVAGAHLAIDKIEVGEK